MRLFWKRVVEWRRCLHCSALCGEVVVKMPSLSPTMSTGTIVSWLKQEGDAISAGDVLCEIQTDKAVVAMEMDDSGVLAKVLVAANVQDVAVGKPIAVVAEPGEDWRKVREATTGEEKAKGETSEQAGEARAVPSETRQPASSSHSRTSKLRGPAVRLLLQDYGLNGDSITASGPQRNLLKHDVLELIASKHLKPVRSSQEQSQGKRAASEKSRGAAKTSDAAFSDIPVSSERNARARRFTTSKKTIPHGYASAVVRVDETLAFLRDWNATSPSLSISLENVFVKAIASALTAVPEVNVQWIDEDIRVAASVDVAITHGATSLAIANVDRLGIADIARIVKSAQSNLQASESTVKGTFTFDYLDDVLCHTAIIQPPQVATLAVGGLQRRFSDDDAVPVPITSVHATLCFDSRAMSEQSATRFLRHLQQCLADPDIMLLVHEVTRIPRENRSAQ